MKPSNFPFTIRLLRQWAIKFLMASVSGILPASVGLLCWLDVQAQQMPQDYWVLNHQSEITRYAFHLAQQMPQDYWVLEGIRVAGQFRSLAIGPDDLIYTGSNTNNGTSISVYNSNFVLIRQFGSFSSIGGIVVNSQTNVFVVDSGQNKIKVFNSQGASIREFGGTGSGDGQFSFDRGYGGGSMADIDRQDRFYVADRNNNRVQVFDAQGAFLRKWGGTTGLPESLKFPPG